MKLKDFVSFHVTLWRPVYKYFVPRFQPKTSSSWLPYQHLSSAANCAERCPRAQTDRPAF